MEHSGTQWNIVEHSVEHSAGIDMFLNFNLSMVIG